jgi:hypothetical protein
MMLVRRGPEYLCIIVCAILQPFAAQLSRAAEWSMEPSVAARTVYNDNFELSAAPHPGVWGVILSPDVEFSGHTETLNVTGGLRLNVNRYFGERGLDSTDHLLTLRSSYKTERDLVGLNIDSVRDSTLVSELFETGVVQARRQRDRLSANPSWSRYLTEATAITASYGYNSVHYADTAGTSLIDYRDQTATLGLRTNLSERDLVSVAAYYDRFETDPKRFEANTYGIQAGYDRAFSETLHGTLVIGARKTGSRISAHALVCEGPILFGICFGDVTTVTSVASSNSTGYTLVASLDKTFETALMSGSLSRAINPSGVGALVQTDRLGVKWTQQWSPTLSASVDASVYQSRYVGNINPASNSRYYRIEPRVSWRITQWWTLSGGYSYSHVKYENRSVAASANAIYAVLSYTWPKLTVSR